MVEVAILQKASFVLLLLGTTLFVVTFAVPYWFSGLVPGGTFHLGLWKTCSRPTAASGIEICTNNDASNINWITQPQGLESAGLVCAVMALFMSIVSFFRPSRLAAILVAVASTVAGILGIAGAAVFTAKMDEDLGSQTNDWCFWLNIVADVVLWITAIAWAVCGHKMPVQDYQSI